MLGASNDLSTLCPSTLSRRRWATIEFEVVFPRPGAYRVWSVSRAGVVKPSHSTCREPLDSVPSNVSRPNPGRGIPPHGVALTHYGCMLARPRLAIGAAPGIIHDPLGRRH